MRRIKGVSVSLPSVVGPYTSVNCTLTLLSSSIRVSSLLSGGAYARDTSNDDTRFVDYFGSVQSVVTSGATNDSGMFETNSKGERFLPFEGAGAISTWSISLPDQFRSFDYSTISDVILHIRYMARDGGDVLGKRVTKELQKMLNDQSQVEQALLFNLRYDFPTEWSAFANVGGPFTFTLRKDYFPYMVQRSKLHVDAITLYAQDPLDTSKLAQTTPAIPATLSNDLSAKGQFDLSFPADPKVLTSAQPQVFLILQYHFGN
jgi:hypothetical protein